MEKKNTNYKEDSTNLSPLLKHLAQKILCEISIAYAYAYAYAYA